MKRSPPPPPTSSSSSSSSSSSCIGPDIPHQSDKLKAKRVRKTHNPDKCLQNANGSAAASSGGGRRSSIYRGVTRHRWTGRFEAHLWDKSSWNNIQNKKGRQVYLGAYDNEEAAAHTYDLAALKYWGPGTTLNFPIETYTKELEEMQNVTKEEYLASLRRRSSGFSRGVSKYRGVARHHHNGRWEARIGRVFGNKYLYLGTYNTQEEAAAAYDMAAIEYRGANAVTNFDISNYIDRLKKKIPGFNVHSLTESEALPNCCTRSEVEVEQPPPPPPQKQQEEMVLEQQQQPHYTQLPPCMDTTSSMEVLDPAANEQGLWSFIDTGFAPLTVPDLPLGKPCELTDLFDHAAFEDDIHLIFEAASNQDGNNMNGAEVVGVSRSMEEDNVQDRLLLSSSTSYSPSSSTTTSVSCIYSA